jgi:arabinogalactan endo-1,4-beta-galactosidase
MDINKAFSLTAILITLLLFCCSSANDAEPNDPKNPEDTTKLIFGADLSYLNHILDKGGVYKDNGTSKDPYEIFAQAGTTVARFRLWHNPEWMKSLDGGSDGKLYNDLYDVEKSIQKARSLGMQVLLDLHFSDTWADPGKQFIPAAWMNIRSIAVLKDSVYNYTFKTLSYYNSKGLMPEFVQIGNETNCGMLYSEAPGGFPAANVCENQWTNLGQVVNAAIKAVRDVSSGSDIKTKIALHVADPKNVDWYFSGLKSNASVTDYDIIGFSYYPLWHTTVPVSGISETIAGFKTKFKKDVIILETAYPWTTASADDYSNLLGGTAMAGYPFTQDGQYNIMVDLMKQVKKGGGLGVIYWEPGWITSQMKDLWGTGSPWENATFFDFTGNTVKAIDYTKSEY